MVNVVLIILLVVDGCILLVVKRVWWVVDGFASCVVVCGEVVVIS